jgi:uridine kinase
MPGGFFSMVNAVKNNKPVVVGVSGGSGSGKTTFCSELVAQLGEATVLHLKQDNYYRDLSHLLPSERDRVNFDHPQALEFELLCVHLKQLVSGADVEVPTYDFATHTRKSQSIRLSPKPVVLIEGILIFSQPGILEHLTHSVFVDAPEEVRLGRRIKRDIEERGRSRESVEAQFFATVAPMHNRYVEPSKENAHIIVSGEKPFDDTLEKLCAKFNEGSRK